MSNQSFDHLQMNTTARLLGIRRRRPSIWTGRLAEIADRLVKAYGLPRLGNYRDPVKEIFYIMLSARTTVGTNKIENCLNAV